MLLVWMMLPLLVQSSTGMITIEPQTPVVREGQPIRLSCKAIAPIKTCLWEVNKELLRNLENDERFEPYGRWLDGECGLQTNMTEAFNGEWICRVLILGVTDRAFKESTNVTLLVLPQVTLQPDPINVLADHQSHISCIVSDGRPTPSIQWKIDEQQITGNLSTEIRKNEDTGLATINETLTYTFRAADNRRKIRCLTTALWLRADEHGEADLVLNVLYPPQPKDPVVINNLAIGQPVDVRINFTANPRPVRLYWELEDGTQVNVEPFPFDTERRSTAGERFEVFQLRQTEANWYEARLLIKSLNAADDGRTLRLTAQSDLNGLIQTEQYMAQIFTRRTDVSSVPSIFRKCPCDSCAHHFMHLRQELEKNRDQLDELIEQIVTLETLFSGFQ